MSSKVVPLRTPPGGAPNPAIYEIRQVADCDFDDSRGSFEVLALIILAFWSGAVMAFIAAIMLGLGR